MHDKKIAFICELAGTKRHGGEQVAMLNLAKGLAKFMYKVDTYSYINQNPEFKISSLIPLKLRLLPFIRDIFFLPFIGRNILRKIDKKYNFIFFSATTLLSFYKPKVKTVVICHIIRSEKFETFSKIPRYSLLFNPVIREIVLFLERKSLNNVDKIIVIREHQKIFLINKLKISPNKIEIIPNGVDTELFKPIEKDKKYQIIFVGRGTIPKGLDTLLDAADTIKGKILIVTKKIDTNLLNIAKSKSNVELKYNANSDELVNLYNESEIFVLPSLDEEQPLTVMEAMSCGLPVIVTLKAAADIVEDKINGYIISDRNSSELSRSIKKLLASFDEIKKISTINRKKIIENYDELLGIKKVINYLNK